LGLFCHCSHSPVRTAHFRLVNDWFVDHWSSGAPPTASCRAPFRCLALQTTPTTTEALIRHSWSKLLPAITAKPRCDVGYRHPQFPIVSFWYSTITCADSQPFC